MLNLIANGQTFTKTITFTSRNAISLNAFATFVYGAGVQYVTHSTTSGIFDGTTWTIGTVGLNETVSLELQVEVIDYTENLTISWEGFADVDSRLENNSGTWTITFDFACDDLNPCIPEPQTLSYEIGTQMLSISEGNSVQIPNTEYRLVLDGHQIQLTDIVGSIISFVDLPDEAFDTYTISINGNYLRLIKNGITIVSNILLPTYTLSGSGSTVYLTNNQTGVVTSYAVPSAGGADGSVTNVVLTGTDLDFTAINGGFGGTVDLSSLVTVDTNTTYTLEVNGGNLELIDDSLAVISSIPLPVDTNTTYTISIVGRTITLTPSSGPAQNITVPDIAVADLQLTGHLIATITDLDGDDHEVKETVTSITYDVNDNLVYVDEEGLETVIKYANELLPMQLMHSESMPIQIAHLMGADPTSAKANFVVPYTVSNELYDTYKLKEWTVYAKNLLPPDGTTVTVTLTEIDGTGLTVSGSEDEIVIATDDVRYHQIIEYPLWDGIGPATNAIQGFMVSITADAGNRVDENTEIHITLYYDQISNTPV